MHATHALVSLNNLASNIAAVRDYAISRSGGKAPLLCMPVKADAYGHGAVRIAKKALSCGVDYLAVATVGEGVELREAGIAAPILLFSIPVPDEYDALVENDLIPFVASAEQTLIIDECADRLNKKVRAHIKVDTGMGRIGCPPDLAAPLAQCIAGCRRLSLDGIATHLACADGTSPEARDLTAAQLRRFSQAVSSVRALGIEPGIVHAANSGATILHPEAYFDMLRPGIILYGYPPSLEAAGLLPTKPLMKLTSRLVFIKKVSAGTTVSYGATWTAPRDTYIGTIPCGYADGLRRELSGALSFTINGARYPQVGRICMDQCMIDLGSVLNARLNDEEVIFDDVSEISGLLHTIPYEITCLINKRVPRVYDKDVEMAADVVI